MPSTCNSPEPCSAAETPLTSTHPDHVWTIIVAGGQGTRVLESLRHDRAFHVLTRCLALAGPSA